MKLISLTLLFFAFAHLPAEAAPVTVNFHYSGRDVTTSGAGLIRGNGSFSYEAEAGRSVYGIADLTGFNFGWTANVPNLGSGNWTYGLNSLTSFNFSPLSLGSFSLRTTAVPANSSTFTDATFSATGVTGQIARGDTGLVLSRGALTIDALSIQDKQKWAERAQESQTVATTFGLMGCVAGLAACSDILLDMITPALTSGGDSTVLNWLGYLGLVAAAATAIQLGSLASMAITAVAIAGAFAGYIGELQQKLADDPPDYNYTIVAAYSNDNRDVALGTNQPFDHLLTSTASSMTRCLEAHENGLKSMERYQGAVLTENTYWANVQYVAMNSFFSDAQLCGRTVGEGIVAIAAALDDLGLPDTTFNRDDFLGAHSMFMNSGIPQVVTRYGSLPESNLPIQLSLQSSLRNYGQSLAPSNNVPEPQTIVLVGIAIAAIATIRRKKLGRHQ